VVLASFSLAPFALSGCDDGSRTTGTQREVSPEDQAHLKNKMESYKGGAPKAKGKGAPGSKK
jgi:hypothetical protein